MSVILLHSGQSGVERGAQRAAVTLGIPVTGVCSKDCRDEFGPFPPELAGTLTVAPIRGSRAVVAANLDLASAVVIVVPEAPAVTSFTGMGDLIRQARRRDVPALVADPTTDPGAVRAWLTQVSATRVLVTGPRKTRWPEGERAGWSLVAGFDPLGIAIGTASADSSREL